MLSNLPPEIQQQVISLLVIEKSKEIWERSISSFQIHKVESGNPIYKLAKKLYDNKYQPTFIWIKDTNLNGQKIYESSKIYFNKSIPDEEYQEIIDQYTKDSKDLKLINLFLGLIHPRSYAQFFKQKIIDYLNTDLSELQVRAIYTLSSRKSFIILNDQERLEIYNYIFKKFKTKQENYPYYQKLINFLYQIQDDNQSKFEIHVKGVDMELCIKQNHNQDEDKDKGTDLAITLPIINPFEDKIYSYQKDKDLSVDMIISVIMISNVINKMNDHNQDRLKIVFELNNNGGSYRFNQSQKYYKFFDIFTYNNQYLNNEYPYLIFHTKFHRDNPDLIFRMIRNMIETRPIKEIILMIDNVIRNKDNIGANLNWYIVEINFWIIFKKSLENIMKNDNPNLDFTEDIVMIYIMTKNFKKEFRLDHHQNGYDKFFKTKLTNPKFRTIKDKKLYRRRKHDCEFVYYLIRN